MKKIIYILIVLSFTQFGCGSKWEKQYPEDTERSKLTPTERLVGKWWRLKKASINGIDYTDSVKNKIGECSFKLEDVKLQVTSIVPPGVRGGISKSDLTGEFGIFWGLGGKSEESLLTEDYYSNTSMNSSQYLIYVLIPQNNKTPSFYAQNIPILKLSESELKVSMTNKTNDSTIINEYAN